jgi:putative oligomerization/nucleic acid binding protein
VNNAPMDLLRERLARGEIDKDEFENLKQALQPSGAEVTQGAASSVRATDGINKAFIVISSIVLVLAVVIDGSLPPEYSSETEALVMGLIVLALWPLIVWWWQSAYNVVIPRIAGCRRISFWEAAGVVLLILLSIFGVSG